MPGVGLRPKRCRTMGTAVPAMGIRGCGYGISVPAHGDLRVWIWEQGRPVWEKCPESPQVTLYGKPRRSRLMGLSGRVELDLGHRIARLGHVLWEIFKVTRYGELRMSCGQVARNTFPGTPADATWRTELFHRYPVMGSIEGSQLWWI